MLTQKNIKYKKLKIFIFNMGSNCTKSYEEQKKALEKKIISFELNLYFIGEDIEPLYKNFNSRKQQDTGEIYSYWEIFYSISNNFCSSTFSCTSLFTSFFIKKLI